MGATIRILYASERPPYPLFLGGAARCAHKLLHALTNDLGADCLAIGSSDYSAMPWTYPDKSEYQVLGVRRVALDGATGSVDCGYRIALVTDFQNSLGRVIDEFKPDVIWAQLEGAKPILELAERKRIQGIYYVHDSEFHAAELREIGNLPSHIVCSSTFLSKKVRKVIGRPTHVVYPCPETRLNVDGDPRGYIAMINPHRVKGIDTFFEIAKRLPTERFLLVESWKLTDQSLASLQMQLAEAPNVHFVRRVSDMRSIYSQTKLLLIPSLWEEGFGMVAIEAQACGIPVIASARGGLPESVGEGGLLVSDYRNPEAWVKAIWKVSNDVKTYHGLARRARRHALSEAFATGTSAEAFYKICSSKFDFRTQRSRGAGVVIRGLKGVSLFGRLFR
jgi:glycosyltransferase involved in cell wall biosynthesis